MAIWVSGIDAEALGIDAIRDDRYARRGDAILGHGAGQHAGHRQDVVDPVPQYALRPAAKSMQTQPVILRPLFIEWRVDFKQHRQTVQAAHPDASEEE